MPSKRLSLGQERLLWEIALEHFGSELLLQIVVELWGTFDTWSTPRLIIRPRLIIPCQCLPRVFLEHLRLDHRAECPHGHSRFDRDGVAAKS